VDELILKGAFFCNYRATIEKCKCDPICCLKCQKFTSHMAHKCMENNKCGTCGGAHMMNGCTEQMKKWCISCNSNNHSSWDRDCLTLAKKIKEFDQRNPKNSLPFFPTVEPWTGTVHLLSRPYPVTIKLLSCYPGNKKRP